MTMLRRAALSSTILAGLLMAGPAIAGIVDSIQAVPGDSLEFKLTSGTQTDLAGTFAGTNENTWGVGRLTSIVGAGSGFPIWAAGEDDEDVTFMIYGIADVQTSPSGPNTNIWSTGATGGSADGLIHIDFYVDSFAAADARFDEDGPASRTAFDKAGDWTDGTLLMQWVLDPGAAADAGDGGFDESLATLFQSVVNPAGTTTGSGNFFASCISANLICDLLNTNMFPTNAGGLSDLEGQFTLDGTTRGLWQNDVNDPVEAIVKGDEPQVPVPEPATLLLLGSGLIGLTALRRRRR